MKERNGGDKSVLLHGFSHFLWEKKKKSLSSEPQHKHHKLVIALNSHVYSSSFSTLLNLPSEKA